MPKKNKKPARNGYWQFFLELRDKNTNRNLSSKDLQDAAARKWTTMSKEDKKPYEDRARVARNEFQAGRLTTDGYDIDELQRQQEEAVDQERKMKSTIMGLLNNCALTGTLADEHFLVVHINHLIFVPNEQKYYICEMAVAAFTLKRGIVDVFHRIVQPGKLPLGFLGGAKAHSKETHQLVDIVQSEPFHNDTESCFRDLIAFMEHFGTEQEKLPPLYADEKTFEMTNRVFQRFSAEFDFRDEIKIYNLQYMLFALKNAAAGKTVWPTETFSYSAIEKDLYCYSRDIACSHHETCDISIYCSRSIVVRYIYTICDICCQDLGIQLQPGSHVPPKSKVSDLASGSTFNSMVSIPSSLNEPSSRRESFSSFYDDNYPPLGGKSGASSLVSFSSMKPPVQWGNSPSTSRTPDHFEGEEVDQSNINPQRRSFNVKFPEHGYKKRQL